MPLFTKKKYSKDSLGLKMLWACLYNVSLYGRLVPKVIFFWEKLSHDFDFFMYK